MKDKIITITFIIFITTFGILHIFFVDESISIFERRKLKNFPEFKLNNTYINELDSYLLDHFPFRDEFRSIKALFNYNILNKLDNNGIYLKDNYIYKSNYPTNKKSINNFIEKTKKLMNLLTKDNQVFIMVIPDKNYYLEEDNFLHIDYDYIYKNINKLGLNTIDIRDVLNMEDYYETDTHWRQEKIDKVVKRMSEVMNFAYKKQVYEQEVYNKFYGVYYGESAIKRRPEDLYYLTNETINLAKVKYLENSSLEKIYNIDKLASLDAYEVYLDGASSFIEIFNDNSKSNKELVIFRDSFGSSLAPLLVEYYKKITIIDNRYINSNNFLNYIEFNNQDILFSYSTLVINSSETLKG